MAAGATEAGAETSIVIEGKTRFVEDDFVAAFRAQQQPGHQIAMIAVGLLLLVVAVLWLGARPLAAGAAGALGLVFGFLAVWLLLAPHHLARKHVQSLHEDEFDIQFRFDQQGMTISGSWGTSSYRFRGIHGFAVRESVILIQTGPVLRMVVPKRAFAPEALSALMGLLEARVATRPSYTRVSDAKLLWRLVALVIATVLLALVAAGLLDVSPGR